MRTYAGIALLAGLLLSGSADAANLIQNGGFENGLTSLPGFVTINAVDNTSITDWTVSDGTVDYIGSYWQPAEGQRSLDLSGISNGTIYQDVATTAGEQYLLSFYVSANPDNGFGVGSPNPRQGTVTVNVNDTPISYTLDAGNSLANMEWEIRTLSFTAGPGATTRIQFSGEPNTNLNRGIALDDVSLTAVPEPAIWAMMIVGFAMLGTMLRRRRDELAMRLA